MVAVVVALLLQSCSIVFVCMSCLFQKLNLWPWLALNNLYANTLEPMVENSECVAPVKRPPSCDHEVCHGEVHQVEVDCCPHRLVEDHLVHKFFLLREIDYSSTRLFARTHLSLRFRFVSVIARNQSLLITEKDNREKSKPKCKCKGERKNRISGKARKPTLSLLYFVKYQQ